MSILAAGRWRITIDDEHLDPAYSGLRAFLRSVSAPRSRDISTDWHVELLAEDRRARAVLDPGGKRLWMYLPLSPAADLQIACIAVLQAAFRGLALVSDDPALVLLHASAVTTPGARTGVAVIDGGAGAGKTSLSLALAERGCLLVNDEFLACEAGDSQLSAFCQPKLPWHIRPDMASHLALSGNRHGLRAFPDRTAAVDAVPVRVLAMPDWTLPAGACVVDHGQLPDACIADHLRKFADPCLDHVSIFAPRHASVTVTGGMCLDQLVEQRTAAMRRSLQRLRPWVRLLRVGIGAPHEIGLAAAAVMASLEHPRP